MPVNRVCLGCRKSLPVSKFFPEKSAKDKVGAFCWDCVCKSNNNRPLVADPVATSKMHWTQIKSKHDKF
jgi:hypothetical protein